MARMIVEVVGDRSKLTRELRSAEADVERFQGKVAALSATTVRSSALDRSPELQRIAKFAREGQVEAKALEDRLAGVSSQLDEVGASGKTAGLSIGRLGAIGVAAAFGLQTLNKVSDILRVTGDEAFTTEGKLRNLGSSLLQGDLIGGIEALIVKAPSASEKLKKLAADTNTTSVDLSNFASKTRDAADATQEQADRLAEATATQGRFGNIAALNSKRLEEQAAAMDVAASKADALAASMEAGARAVASVNAAIEAAGGNEAKIFGPESRQSGITQRDAARNARTGGAAGFQAPDVGLPQRIQTAIALARADVTTTADELAQYRRAVNELRAQLQIPNITDADKEKIATAITSYQGAIDSILKADASVAAKTKNLGDGKDPAEDLARSRRERAIAAAELAVDTAATTKGYADDLAALNKLESVLRGQLAADTTNLDLQRQLLDVATRRRDVVAKQREARVAEATARQFRILGLTGEGEQPTPSKENLRKRLGSFSENVKGTFLDTGKTQTQLKRFRKVLAEALVPKEIRAKFAEMLDDLNQQLRGNAERRGPLTKTTSLNADRILEGLGLAPADRRELEARLSKFNSAGVALAGRPGTVGAFGVPAGAGAPPIVVHTYVNVDGKKVATSTTKHQQQQARRNPSQKRGRVYF